MGKKKGQSHEDPAAASSISELAYSVPSHGGSGPYVLVEAEDVVGVVAALERLEPVVLLCPIGLADTLLSLLHEEVHVDARVVGLQRRPEVPDPLPLLLKALGPLGRAGDVVRMPRAASAEGRLVLAHARDRPST